ncbi:mRNA decay activator protein ZFP36L2 [Brachionichthys hirsutus]|uniref:mRNA decay activator protein ZFP36L2 n=1 Tax=Brachionichthys hirsutus TaxID=412623 RepID=UPI003604CFE8
MGKHKDGSTNMNALRITGMLDRNAAGAPVTTPGGCLAPGFFRRNSTSNSDNYGSPKEKLLDEENEFRERACTGRAAPQHKPASQVSSARYKTELCRPFEENGACKYGDKCQFAHGFHELRSLSRHPKYKTEPCRTFHTIGFCPYGPRCHFIHNADERRPVRGHEGALPPLGGPPGDRPRLQHSLSFSGFSSGPVARTPPPSGASSCASESRFYEEVLSPSAVSSCLDGGFSFPGRDLEAFLAPLALRAAGGPPTSAYYGNAPGFEAPPSPPDSLSDRESYASGSLSSPGSLSGSESPSLEAGRRLPIFSRLSVSDD